MLCVLMTKSGLIPCWHVQQGRAETDGGTPVSSQKPRSLVLGERKHLPATACVGSGVHKRKMAQWVQNAVCKVFSPLTQLPDFHQTPICNGKEGTED